MMWTGNGCLIRYKVKVYRSVYKQTVESCVSWEDRERHEHCTNAHATCTYIHFVHSVPGKCGSLLAEGKE